MGASGTLCIFPKCLGAGNFKHINNIGCKLEQGMDDTDLFLTIGFLNVTWLVLSLATSVPKFFGCQIPYCPHYTDYYLVPMMQPLNVYFTFLGWY